MARLLVVEDDETIGEALRSGLRLLDHEVLWECTAEGALQEVTEADFDLVLLDLGLPDGDGVEVCRKIRAIQPACVLVVLTARQDEMDVIVGLEAGADDYLTKPFGFTELLARIRAHLRRQVVGSLSSSKTTLGDLVVDTAGRRCHLTGREVPLRTKEFDLLARLVAEPDVAVSRENLMADVWDENWFGSTKTLAVALANRPALVLADEPVAEHEHAGERGLLDLLRLQTEYGSAVVIASRGSAARRVADRVVELRDTTAL